MEHPEEEVSKLLKRALGDAKPPQGAQDRIMDGALARRAAPRWPLLIAAAATAAVIFVWTRPAPAPKIAQRPAEVAPEPPSKPTQTQLTSTGPQQSGSQARTLGVGPHQATLEAQSEADFQSLDPQRVQIALSKGSVRLSVAPLSTGGTFVVNTPQTKVRVVGTEFRVALLERCTEVSVTEGKVWVGPETLEAGQSTKVCEPEDHGEALVQKALALIGQKKDPEQAITLLETYREKHPGGVFEEEALFHLGVLYLDRGERTKVEQMHRALIQRGSDKGKLLGRLRRKKSGPR